MPRPKPTSDDLERRKSRAEELKTFMRDNLLTEVKIADLTGVSRRTIQMIRGGYITPTITTRRKIEALLSRYAAAR